MFNSKLQKVLNAKSKALKVFTDTKLKFERAIEDAQKHVEANRKEQEKAKEELLKLQDETWHINKHIEDMKKSVTQISHIVGE